MREADRSGKPGQRSPDEEVAFGQRVGDGNAGQKAGRRPLKDCPPEMREVLLLRQQLAKSSVKKYIAMKNAVCADGRARGMFLFYGANRTGGSA